jgi:hypothetical protein
VWWLVGGVLIAATVVRWVTGRNQNRPGAVLDQPERVLRAFEAVHRRRRVAIGEAEEGPVLIRGKVSLRSEPLISPLTQRACVFYDVRVDDLMRPSPSSTDQSEFGAWAPSTRARSMAMLHQREARPFLVTDETGTALVAFDDLAEVSLVVPAQISLSGRKLREATALESALFKLGVPRFGNVAVHESAIFVGDEVRVAGMGMREVTPDAESAGYRSAPTRYVVRASADSLLAILRPNH